MSIQITWPNINSAIADSIYVYRSASPIPDNTLPAPIATLPGNAVSYTDTNVERNKLYYYRIGVLRGGDLLLSDNVIFGYFPITGPGPQTLLRGNWKLGYFGFLTTAELFSFSEIYNTLGLSIGSLVSDLTNNGWHKFVREGSILFLPNNTTMINSVTWNSLYANGLVYGRNDNGTPPAGSTAAANPVNQRRVVTKGSLSYIVRCPKGSTLGTEIALSSASEGFEYSEWAELISRLYVASSLASNSEKWNDLSGSPNAWTQHVRNSSNAIMIAGESPTVGSMNTVTSFFPILELML